MHRPDRRAGDRKVDDPKGKYIKEKRSSESLHPITWSDEYRKGKAAGHTNNKYDTSREQLDIFETAGPSRSQQQQPEQWDAYDEKILGKIAKPVQPLSPKTRFYKMLAKKFGKNSTLGKYVDRIDDSCRPAAEYFVDNRHYISERVKTIQNTLVETANLYRLAALGDKIRGERISKFQKRGECAVSYKHFAKKLIGMANQLEEWKIKNVLPQAMIYFKNNSNLDPETQELYKRFSSLDPTDNTYKQTAEEIMHRAEWEQKYPAWKNELEDELGKQKELRIQ